MFFWACLGSFHICFLCSSVIWSSWFHCTDLLGACRTCASFMSIAVVLIYVLNCFSRCWYFPLYSGMAALALPCTPTCAGTQTISGVSVSSAADLWMLLMSALLSIGVVESIVAMATFESVTTTMVGHWCHKSLFYA